MKKRLTLLTIFTVLFSIILSVSLFVKADDVIEENEDVVVCSDIVDSNGGTVEFKKIDPLFDTYNINNHSETIDTVNTIEEVMVLGTQSSNTVFTFKTHLNRDYLTKYFNILEWFIVPTKVQPYGEPNYGAEFSDSDFETFEITIKDVNNPDKYVIFKTSNRPDSSTYCTSVSGRTGGNGQSVEGILASEPDQINKMWGTALKASHVGSFTDYDGVPNGFDPKLPLGGFVSLDYETKQVFSVTGADRGKRVMVRDLDDGRFLIGTDSPWEGFDSKELEVSIRFLNIVSGRTAQVAILSYNGMDFTKSKVLDNKAPIVYESTILDEDILYGEINKPMPITSCYSYDLLDGYIKDIDYKVYYNYEGISQKEIKITDGKFLPDRYGTYSIVATTVDRFGNEGKHVRNVDIRRGVTDLKINLLDELPSHYNVGETIYLPKAYIYGGLVNKKYDVSVLFNNNNVDIDKDGSFVPTKQGLYTLRYTVTDYYGVPTYFDYPVIARISEKPIVSFPEIDPVVETGVSIKIPDFSAVDYYSFSDGVNANLTFAIKEPSSSLYKEVKNDYVPNEEGTYKLRITASNVLNKELNVSKEYEFYAKDCKLIRDFFITNKMNIVEENGEMAFVVNAGDGSFYFLNPIINKSVELEFIAINQDKVSPNLVITLTDAMNKNHSVTLLIEKNKVDSSTLSNLENKVSIAGAIGDGKSAFNLLYSNGWIYDNNKAVLKISNYDNGDVFDGFSSGKLYIDVVVKGTTEDTKIMFTKFCGNQDFSYNADDITEPTIIYSDLGRIYKIGEEVSFTYDSFDLFDQNCNAVVRVEYDGKTITNGENGMCSFEITDFGKYNVIFKATDKFTNETSLSFNIYCYDNISPTISVSKNVDSECELGKTMSLPSASVSDNIDTDLKYSIYAMNQTGSFVIIENNEFKPTVKGIWTIYYYVSDSYGNYALVSFSVNVY